MAEHSDLMILEFVERSRDAIPSRSDI